MTICFKNIHVLHSNEQRSVKMSAKLINLKTLPQPLQNYYI